MSDIVKRLRASSGMDAINGDHFERSVCASQMKEAADEIQRLQEERTKTLEKCLATLPKAKEWELQNGKRVDMVPLHLVIKSIKQELSDE